jgi:hypothetical protein
VANLTGDADQTKIAVVETPAVPPPEPSAASPTEWWDRFSTAVDEHGWGYALRQAGWGALLKLVIAMVAAAFAELTQSAASRPQVKSSNDVTREVLAELNATEPVEPGPSVRDHSPPVSPATRPASTAANEPDPERLLRALQRREQAERDSVTTRLVIARGREKTLYGAHLCSALLTVVLAFVAVGLVFVGSVPVAVASAAIAIIPGSGTFLLRRMWDKERSKQEVLEASRSEHAAIVDAVEGALSVPDPAERNRLVSRLAERLQDRAFAS